MPTELDDLKAHLNISDDADDALIQQKLDVAKEWVASITGGTLNPVPAPVAEATRQLAAHLFENREAALVGVSAQELPMGVMDMLNPYREWAF